MYCVAFNVNKIVWLPLLFLQICEINIEREKERSSKRRWKRMGVAGRQVPTTCADFKQPFFLRSFFSKLN